MMLDDRRPMSSVSAMPTAWKTGLSGLGVYQRKAA